jgi:hypothetical protein
LSFSKTLSILLQIHPKFDALRNSKPVLRSEHYVMKAPSALCLLLLAPFGFACQRAASEPNLTQSASSPVDSPVAPAVSSSPVTEISCDAPRCQFFATAQDAFQYVLKKSPRILSIGEFHAQKGYEQLPSAVERFAQTMLPSLQGKASDLVVEVWIPPSNCSQEQKKVEKEQHEVKKQQSARNPNDYVALAQQAKKVGIEPFPLRPTCDDFRAVNSAGDDSILKMLELTARMLRSGATRAYERSQKKADSKLILTFGGAMHNDIHPDHSCGKNCSFGEDLLALTQGQYIELDMVIPEYVEDRDFWRARSWYPHYNRSMTNGRAVLLNPSPSSYVLVFPNTPDFKPVSEN